MLTFVVARESADSLWASQSLTTPPGPAVARTEIASLEVDRIQWSRTGRVILVTAASLFAVIVAIFGAWDPDFS